MLSKRDIAAIEIVRLLARYGGTRKSGEIAEALGQEPRYLEKELQRLSGAGILTSARGRHGGYSICADWACGRNVGSVLHAIGSDCMDPPDDDASAWQADLHRRVLDAVYATPIMTQARQTEVAL